MINSIKLQQLIYIINKKNFLLNSTIYNIKR